LEADLVLHEIEGKSTPNPRDRQRLRQARRRPLHRALPLRRSLRLPRLLPAQLQQPPRPV